MRTRIPCELPAPALKIDVPALEQGRKEISMRANLSGFLRVSPTMFRYLVADFLAAYLRNLVGEQVLHESRLHFLYRTGLSLRRNRGSRSAIRPCGDLRLVGI